MTERDLIAGIVRGDNAAVRQLVDTYHQRMIKTAFHFVKDMEDAEDIAQDVCLEILRSAKHFKGSSSLYTWIYRITVNKSLNLVRKNKRRIFFSQAGNLFFHADGPGASPSGEPQVQDTSLENNELRILLDRAVNSLPENQRIAFVLSKYDELSYKQISEIMNLSLSSVESLLFRAKLSLQKKLAVHYSEYVKKN